MFLRTRKKMANPQSLTTSSSRIYGRFKEENAEIERFRRNSGDSSDEEDDYPNHDINKDFKKSCPQKKYKHANTLADDWLLCYVVSYAANEFFHDRINKKYYKLKKKYLTQTTTEDPVSQLQRRVQEAVITSVDQTIILFNRFLLLTSQSTLKQKEIEKITQAVRSNFLKKANELIESELLVFIKWFRIDSDSADDSHSKELEGFENNLVALLVEEFMQHFSFDEEEHDREKVKKKLLVLAKSRMTEITSDFGFEKKAYNQGKNDAIDLLMQYTGPYQNLISNVRSILDASPARGLVVKLIANKLTNKKAAEELTKAFVEDLISIKTKVLEDKKAKTRRKKEKLHDLSHEEQDAFDKYFTYADESVKDEISQLFKFHLDQELKKNVRKFHRQTLDNSHLFASGSIEKFMANIRLLNRSQTRKRLNLKYSIFQEDVAIRNWRLTKPFLQGADVCEIQKILKVSLGRMDMVLGLGNYEDVYSCIDNIKLYFKEHKRKVKDKDIAEWIGLILNGTLPDLLISKEDQQEILSKLQAITYLIFGCEVARNPAMLIINRMLLDLIMYDSHWSFKEAFTGRNKEERSSHLRRMPMAPEGAVAAARALENKLQKSLPYHYSYQGVCDEAGVDTMVEQEAKIVRDWLAYKEIKPPKKLEKNTMAEWLLNVIKDEYENWFNLSSNEIVDSEESEKNIIRVRR